MMAFGRVLRTGLAWLRHRAANLRCRLAALRFNPSRWRYFRMTQRDWERIRRGDF
jgi:hypothetical protein